MIARLQNILNVRAGEGRPVLIFTAYYFLITATAIAGRSVSNALFFSRVDNAREIFPLMLITVTLTGVVIMAIYTRLARRMPLVPLLMATGLVFASALVGLRLFSTTTWASYALFVLMEVVNVVMFFQFYTLAGTVFDTRQAKRIFGILGIGGAVASILSGLALRPFTDLLGSEAVILLAVVFIGLWVTAIWQARPYMRPMPTPQAVPQKSAGLGRLDPYLLTIALVIVATILVSTTVEYQFKVISTGQLGSDDAALTAFFGTFFALVGFFQILIRLFVVGNLLARFGILAGLIMLPIGLALSSAAVLLSPVLLSAVLLKGVDQVVRYTLNETSMELLWVPIAPQRKAVVKPLINGTIPTVFQGITGLMILFVVAQFPVQALSVVILVIIAFWIPLAWRLRRGYVNALMASIEKRELVLEDLTIDTTDAAIVRSLDQALNTGDEVQQAFTLGLIEDLNLNPWAKTLGGLFRTSDSFFIRQKILDMAGAYPNIIDDAALLAILENERTELVDEALRAAARRNMVQIIPILERCLDPEQDIRPEVRAAAASAALTLNAGPVTAAQDTLRAMLENADSNASALALSTLAQLPTEMASAVVHESTLREMLHNRSTRARLVILEMITNPGYWAQEKPADNETIVSVALNLGKPATRQQALEVLSHYPDAHVVEVLTTLLRAPNIQADVRIGVLVALQHYPDAAVAAQILDQMRLDQLAVYRAGVDSLLHIARQTELDESLLARINAEVMALARTIYKYHVLLASQSDPLLSEMIAGEIQNALPSLLKLAVMDVPHTRIEAIIAQLDNPQTLGNILELFDNVLSRSEREVLIPLFEGHPTAELAARGQRYFNALDQDTDQTLRHYMMSGTPWQSLVTLAYALSQNRHTLLAKIDWYKVPSTVANRQIVSQHRDRLQGLDVPEMRFPPDYREDVMYTLLEKTILLKSAALFQDVPADQIFHIAQITTEETLAGQSTLFQEGDTGDCLYILVEGQVRVHKGSQELAIFQKGDALGEMALFDHLPRSATATALTDCTLLKIDHAPFVEVMASHVAIMQSMVRTLSLRVRAANEQVAELNAQL
jgi:hypothetical protein